MTRVSGRVPSAQSGCSPVGAHDRMGMSAPFARWYAARRASRVMALVLVLDAGALFALADDPAPAPPAISVVSAYESVREGNQLLRDGKAEDALKVYDEAAKLAPGAREIPFARGIAQYELGRFDEARQSFQDAALSSNRALAADAAYGIGAAHHAEALAHSDDPKQVLSHLEQAMSQYRTLLANQPNHAFAREADSKAARMWKQVKQQLEQQQQQQDDQQQNQNQDQQQSDQQQQQQQDQQDGENSQDQSEQQQQQSQEQNSNEQQSQENQQQAGEQDQKNEDQSQQQSSQQQEAEEQDDQEKEQAASEQRTSREQAERRLREMMQELRDRRKAKERPVERPLIAPVDKDW